MHIIGLFCLHDGMMFCMHVSIMFCLYVVCLFCFGFFVIYQARTALKDHWLYLTITNTREDVGTNSDLWKGYVDYTGYDVTQKMVEFNDEIYFDYSKNKAAGNKYYEVFVATVDSGVLDAVTMEPEELSSLGESGRLMDLRDERCSTIYKNIKTASSTASPTIPNTAQIQCRWGLI